ncbi:MAG: hypothetical protein ACI9WU_005089 [Myxococcota bacterium]
MKEFWQKEHRLILAVLGLVALLNVPYGQFVLYPLMLFSTWIHELCHGLAALILGGSIDQLEIFADGTGLARTYRPVSRFATAWVASAGYVGTSVIGALMLWLRRKKGAGRFGLTFLGLAMVISAVLFVRNRFGLLSVLGIGVMLIGAGWYLQERFSGLIYTFVAATCCLNAFTSIKVLFSANLVVDGQPVGGSDAHTVAEALWLPHWFWASLWIALGLVLMFLVLRSPLKGRGSPAKRAVVRP